MNATYLENRRREVEAEKELFEKASPEEKRVLIAKDVLAHLEAIHIIPAPSKWVDTNVYYQTSHKQVKDAFLSEKHCYCCALGAAFMCLIERENKVTNDELRFSFQSSFFQRLKDFFGENQMELIEMYFEGSGAYFIRRVKRQSDQIRASAIAWKDNNEHPLDRMQKIMQNIIDNNGKFVPETL